MNSRANGREFLQALIPPENIIVPVSLSAPGLYYGNTREQAPIELIIVCCVYELFGQFENGTMQFIKESFQKDSTRVATYRLWLLHHDRFDGRGPSCGSHRKRQSQEAGSGNHHVR